LKKLLRIQLNKIKKYILSDIKKDSKIEKLLLAKILVENIRKKKNIYRLSEIGFKVFSQFDEDGII